MSVNRTMPFSKRAKSPNDVKEQGLQRQTSDSSSVFKDSSSVFKDSEEKGDLKVAGIKTSLTLVVNDDQNEADRRQKKKPTGTDYSKLLSGLYGISLILIGFLFPVIDALSDKWLQLEYTTAFTVYIYSVATIFLIYLQIHLLRSNQHHHKHRATTKDATHPHLPTPPLPSPLPPPIPPPITITTLNTEDVDPVPSPITPTEPTDPNGTKPKKFLSSHSHTASESETPRAETTTTTKQRRHRAKHRNLSAMVRYSSTTNVNSRPAAADHEVGANAMESPSRLADLESDQFGEKVEEEFEVWIDMSKLGSIFSHEGSSFYLRLGCLFFGIGHLIYVCLELENSSYIQPGCSGSAFWWTYIFHLVFIVVQTFFLFKNETVHIHDLKWVARFGAAHLTATNICVWLRTLVNEIMQEFKHIMDHAHDHTSPLNITTTIGTLPHHRIAERAAQEGDCPYYRGILQSASIYLFPFVLEYSLIAMGTTIIIYISIDDQTKDDVVRGLTNFFKVQAVDLSDVENADQSTGKDDDSEAHHGHGPSVLLKSHRGLFAGILLLVCCAVSITLFFFAMDTQLNMPKAELIYLISDVLLHSILLVAAVAATVRIHRLSFIAKPISVDDLLLYLSMVGTLVLDISVAIAAGNAVMSDGKNLSLEGLRLAGAIIGSVQTIVQVILIMSGMRRYPSKASHVKEMPGRGLLTFLVVGNVSVWIFRTMQAKELSLQGTQSAFYGNLAWLLLMNVNLPLLLFYRFHSSVCLADVWAIAYTPLHQKVPTPPEANLQQDGTTSPAGDPRSSRLLRSISVQQLPGPVPESRLSRPAAAGIEDGIDNKSFQLDGVSHVSSVSSLASENF